MYRRKQPDTIPALKRALIGDSLERKRWTEKLIKLVREDERGKADRGRGREKVANEG